MHLQLLKYISNSQLLILYFLNLFYKEKQYKYLLQSLRYHTKITEGTVLIKKIYYVFHSSLGPVEAWDFYSWGILDLGYFLGQDVLRLGMFSLWDVL
jgi:hypothetical protein